MESAKIALPGQYLTFLLNGQQYAVPISAVREINRVAEITPVPQLPAHVAGVMNLRGKVIPVADLRQRLGIERAAHTKATCIIVIESEGNQIGTIVDSVIGVTELGASQIEAAPSLAKGPTGHVAGIGKQESQVIILLDIVGCLSTDLRDALSGAA